MFCAGSAAFAHPKRRAVSGISCIRPCAFFGDSASGSKLDSCAMTASTTWGCSWYSGATSSTKRTICGGAWAGGGGGGSSAGVGRARPGAPGRPAGTASAAVVAASGSGSLSGGRRQAGGAPLRRAQRARHVLRLRHALLGRGGEQVRGLRLVTLDATRVGQHPGQAVLRLGITKARGAAVQLRRTHRVAWHPVAMLERLRLLAPA
jgi:hypothetical protein